jgi:hypothetical protein
MVTARKAAAAVCGESGKKKKREGKGTWADRVEWERLA